MCQFIVIHFDYYLIILQETIACLIDRVYENREKNKTVDLNPINVPNKDILNSKVNID